MAEKNPSPDPKSQQADSKSSAQAGGPSDPSQPSTSMSPAGNTGAAGSATPAGDAPNSDSHMAPVDVSPEFEMTFQRLFDQNDFVALMEALEIEELEAPNGVPATVVYERLLAVYLLQNDFFNAKLLWKRIPTAAKTADSELSAIWSVGQKVSKSDFAGIYEALRRPWKTHDKLMRKMFEVTRRRAIDLVAKAYESITVDNLTTLLGTSSEEETKSLAREMQWDMDGKMVFPKTDAQSREGRGKIASGDAHLGLLTDYVSFLEGH